MALFSKAMDWLGRRMMPTRFRECQRIVGRDSAGQMAHLRIRWRCASLWSSSADIDRAVEHARMPARQNGEPSTAVDRVAKVVVPSAATVMTCECQIKRWQRGRSPPQVIHVKWLGEGVVDANNPERRCSGRPPIMLTG